MEGLQNFQSHRFPVLSKRGIVSSNQPEANNVGRAILEQGGNAADAAVAMAAVISVTEPTSTGLGGDAFCLFYDATDKKVKGLNGSGHSPAALTQNLVTSRGFSVDNPVPEKDSLRVTVPGTAAAWEDTIKNFGSGKFTLSDLLKPSISIAENGWPVAPVAAALWRINEESLTLHRYGGELLLDGKPPRIGEIMKLPDMATSLKELADGGAKQFYTGKVGQAIVEEVQYYNGVLSMDDLAAHTSTIVDPISTDYKGYTVWEIPPNGLGLTTLLALNILKGFDLQSLGHTSVEYLHLLIEALKLSFADTLYFITDPDTGSVPVAGLLSEEYATERRKLISLDKAGDYPVHGNPDIKESKHTIYLSVVDENGNACSFINSTYDYFGTGIVPKGCGFTLHNRGAIFSMDPSVPNAIGPKKRPQHTIIPSMVTKTGTNELLASFGIMGGFMQAQAQIQVLLSMIEYGMDPQQALDIPRFRVEVGNSQPWSVSAEKEIPESIVQGLQEKGHKLIWPVTGYDRAIFGRGHVITNGAWFTKETDIVDTNPGVLWAAADPRCDGYPQSY